MRYFLLLVLSLFFSECLVVTTNYDKLPPGPYRGVFLLDGRQSQRLEPDEVASDFNLETVNKGELPFNFILSYAADSSMTITLVNGSERIEVPDVTYKRLLTTARDSLTFRFPLNDAYFTGYHEDGIIEGYYVDETRDGGKYRIPMMAKHGLDYRFTQLKKTPAVDLSGRWEVEFGIQEGVDSYPAIAEFKQTGNNLEGTFLTTTGDYRYLQGTIQEDRAYLSTFDGSHVFLFSFKLQADGSLLGLFRSGTHYETIWKATRNAGATLPDATLATTLRDGATSLELSGILPNGNRLGLNDLPGKIKVVSLFGSWCPNCKDEALFLDSLRQTVSATDVSFYGAAFERMRDTTRALAAVQRFGESLNIGFPLALVGDANKAEATKTLGILDEIKSFPTLMIVDENNQVVYVHTGFAGPATSEYGEFTRAFAKTLQNYIER